LRLAGVTLTDATGTGVTVTVAEPLCPSLVAVTVAVPALAPVTTPDALTVATVELSLAQVTMRPVSGFPAASRGVAVSGPVCPSVRSRLAGVTLTDATGTGAGVTVTVADPLCPSFVAVTVAVPALAPVTTPDALTVAAVALSLAQVTTRPVSGFPAASRGVAVSGPVCPSVRSRLAGVTLTDATGASAAAVTVTVAYPICPSLLAVTVATPARTARTRPFQFTVAIAGSLLTQVITRHQRRRPQASRGVAVSWPVWPTVRLRLEGVTLTDATTSALMPSG